MAEYSGWCSRRCASTRALRPDTDCLGTNDIARRLFKGNDLLKFTLLAGPFPLPPP